MKNDSHNSWIASRASAERYLAKRHAGLNLRQLEARVHAALSVPLNGTVLSDRRLLPLARAAATLIREIPAVVDVPGVRIVPRAELKPLLAVLERIRDLPRYERTAREHQRHLRDDQFRFAFTLASVVRLSSHRAFTARMTLAAAIAWGFEGARSNRNHQDVLVERWEERTKRARRYLRAVRSE